MGTVGVEPYGDSVGLGPAACARSTAPPPRVLRHLRECSPDRLNLSLGLAALFDAPEPERGQTDETRRYLYFGDSVTDSLS